MLPRPAHAGLRTRVVAPSAALPSAALSIALLGTILGACASARGEPGPALPRPDAAATAARPSGQSAPAPTGHKTLWPTFGVNAGGALLGNFTTDVRLDSSTLGRGTGINFEDELGFTSSTEVGRLDAYWRITRHHRIDFSYFDIERTHVRTIDRDLQWGEVVFPINTTVTSFFDTEIFKGAYRWTPFAHDTWELGVSVGFHWMDLASGIGSPAVTGSEDFSADAPLPVVGLHGEWEFLPRLRLRASTELFGVSLENVGSFDDVQGFITDNLLAVEWDTLDFLGLGVGYNYFLLDLSVGSDRLTFSGEYSYSGVLVYGRMFF